MTQTYLNNQFLRITKWLHFLFYRYFLSSYLYPIRSAVFGPRLCYVYMTNNQYSATFQRTVNICFSCSDSLKSVSLYVVFARHERTLMHISSMLTDNIELISRSRRPSHVLTLQHVARETSLINGRKGTQKRFCNWVKIYKQIIKDYSCVFYCTRISFRYSLI